jgi:hypothetical protein
MPLNTLAGQTAAGTKPKATGFENFQSVMQNMKKQQQPTALSNFYGLNKATTSNIQGQNQQVNKQTEAQKQLYSDDKIKNMMDDLKTKASDKMKSTTTKLDEGVGKVGTVSFPGSPSDEHLTSIMDGTYKADTKLSAADLDANSKIVSDDLADGKIDDQKTRDIFEKLLADDATGEMQKGIEEMIAAIQTGMVNNMGATPPPAAALGNTPDINDVNTEGNWGAAYTDAATGRNTSLEALRQQAIKDLLGIEYGVADDVTPQDTWGGQLNDTNKYEDLAYQQAQLLENPNSTPESVYGALGLSQTGNAYFDAINRSGARNEAINAMRDAEGSTANRDAAKQGFTTATKDYMGAMKDIESRWDEAGTSLKGELDTLKTGTKDALDKKDLGKISEADITAKAKTLTDAQAKAQGIKEVNTKNSEYMKLLQANKEKYTTQVTAEKKAATEKAAAAETARIDAAARAKVSSRPLPTITLSAPEIVAKNQLIEQIAAQQGISPADARVAFDYNLNVELQKKLEASQGKASLAETVKDVSKALGVVFPAAFGVALVAKLAEKYYNAQAGSTKESLDKAGGSLEDSKSDAGKAAAEAVKNNRTDDAAKYGDADYSGADRDYSGSLTGK